MIEPLKIFGRIVFVLFLFFIVPIKLTLAQDKLSVGWVEKVKIYPGNVFLHAKLDTGADNSSLHASNLEEFERDGAQWVRFELDNRYGKNVVIEKEVQRIAIVKRHRGPHQKRKVIRIGICLGNIYMETDVSLIDRRNFEYQMLIGRTYLAGKAIIDPSVSYTSLPSCEVEARP